MQQGKYAEARQAHRKLLQRRPDFVPALNNLSLLSMIEGSWIRPSRQRSRCSSGCPTTSTRWPSHALLLPGRPYGGGGTVAERLKAVQSEAADVWVKKPRR